MTKLRAGFIGAGPRARSAHYPMVAELERVELVAISELDEERGRQVAGEYEIPRTYFSHRDMLERENLDLVYCIMNEGHVLEPALDCLAAGCHIMIEKPPGLDSVQTGQMLKAAEEAGLWAMVAFQRRFAAVTQEALRRVAKKGRSTLAIGTFNKPDAGDTRLTTTLWNDVCHVVDLVRYMAAGEADEVTAYRDRLAGDDLDHYTALLRFDNGATGCVFGHRASGGRVLGFELHGIGVGCYARIPYEIAILEDGETETLSGWEIAGVDRQQVRHYDGQVAMHEHFLHCIVENETPLTDLRDVIHTAHLVDRIEAP